MYKKRIYFFNVNLNPLFYYFSVTLQRSCSILVLRVFIDNASTLLTRVINSF